MMAKSNLLRFSALIASAGLLLAACGGDSTDPGSEGGSDVEKEVDAGSDETPLEAVTIGITQIVEHPSLDAAREGFKDALLDAGYTEDTITFDEQNAQGEMATATSIASKFDADGVDLVLAIATPTAQAAAQSITDIPILFTAVTEPQEAGIVASWDEPGANVTGTSDLNPVEEQIELIAEIAPDAKTVGVIYSSGEVNSEVQVELAREATEKLGLELKEVTVSASADVSQAAESIKDVDAIYVPTDNTVVEALEAVIQVAEQEQILMIVGEGDSVERGGVATFGLNYYELGYQTGKMAARILLEGADPATMPVETQDVMQLIVNEAAAERMGVTLPEEFVAKADELVTE